ncbi:MAG: DUF368 domain-containing protein [Eggerthellaceae bacterium]|nr:DUF368 domain-containing protein [Eggerthellaceae bacterium]
MKIGPHTPMQFILKILQGTLVGVGAVLPGISGGVLCVVFGIYRSVMEFLAEPIRNFKTHLPMLLPYGIGLIIGFLGIANVLSVLLNAYPAPSVCVFVGLITGMLPSLFREAGKEGRSTSSYASLIIAAAFIFALLIGLRLLSVTITPNFLWYVFCGFCLALSVIAPGMSFSTLLMPLGLYEPFVSGIGHMDFAVLIPGGIGCLATIILLAKAVNALFEHRYSVAFHAIVGIVIAATIMIIPFESFLTLGSCIVNIICIVAGAVAALILDNFNQKHAVE